jgi:hypothetical protein
VLARAEAWLLEPAPAQPAARAVALPPRPVVAVVGLSERCGASTVARALGAMLAARDPSGGAIVAGSGDPPTFAPAVPAARRLAGQMSSGGSPAWAAGRLCLTDTHDHGSLAALWRQLAPIVFEVPRGASASGADLTILVAPGEGEPALAELAAGGLLGAGRQTLTVVNHADDPGRWRGRAALILPRSRAGARLAAAGWEPRGALGARMAELGELCEAAICA